MVVLNVIIVLIVFCRYVLNESICWSCYVIGSAAPTTPYSLPIPYTTCQFLIVSRILCALPAWAGLLWAELKGRINAFLRRLHKYGFPHSTIDTEHLLTSSDRKLFKNMQRCEHCLNHLFPPCKDIDIELRPAGHDFLLAICNYELHRRSFVVRCLFLTF